MKHDIVKWGDLTPHYDGAGVTVFHGDCLHILRGLPDESVHAVVTDPPYGLSNTDPGHVSEAITHWTTEDRAFLPSAGGGFMGKAWDEFVPPPAVWDECMRVLKPGGHLLAFAGSRTVDLMALSIRLAGFDIRDSIAWLYGSGFPKSLDVALAIDKAQGHERQRQDPQRRASASAAIHESGFGADGWAPAVREAGTEDAKAWQGWGTALKPAFEPIVVARKPLAGTVASNVLAHGTGALNIDANRVAMSDPDREAARVPMRAASPAKAGTPAERAPEQFAPADGGRWPANVVLDESQAAELDRQAPDTGAQRPVRGSEPSAPVEGGGIYGRRERVQGPFHGDRGGASRMFPTFRYEAKAPTSERPVVDGVAHPTVKPLDLMRWLVRLVTPKGGTVLEPFAGSGTTVEACIREGFDVIAIEREADYLPLIEKRIRKDHAQGLDFDWGDVA